MSGARETIRNEDAQAAWDELRTIEPRGRELEKLIDDSFAGEAEVERNVIGSA